MSLQQRRDYFRVNQIAREKRHPNVVEIERFSSGESLNTFKSAVMDKIRLYKAENLKVIESGPSHIPPWTVPPIDVCFYMCKFV